jgi:competence protein ComEA
MNRLQELLQGIEPGIKKRAAIAAGMIAIVLGVWFSNSAAVEVGESMPVIERVLTPTTFMVHVAGAVKEPGLYELEAGARVSDAISQAGGFSESALESSINLARLVSDGEQIVVLDHSQIEASGGFISLNSASASKLEELPGIGPATAKKIIEYRMRIGSFSSVDQITEVAGIGSKLLERIRDQLTL